MASRTASARIMRRRRSSQSPRSESVMVGLLWGDGAEGDIDLGDEIADEATLTQVYDVVRGARFATLAQVAQRAVRALRVLQMAPDEGLEVVGHQKVGLEVERASSAAERGVVVVSGQRLAGELVVVMRVML